jgi:hypothetical protein
MKGRVPVSQVENSRETLLGVKEGSEWGFQDVTKNSLGIIKAVRPYFGSRVSRQTVFGLGASGNAMVECLLSVLDGRVDLSQCTLKVSVQAVGSVRDPLSIVLGEGGVEQAELVHAGPPACNVGSWVDRDSLFKAPTSHGDREAQGTLGEVACHVIGISTVTVEEDLGEVEVMTSEKGCRHRVSEASDVVHPGVGAVTN